MTFEITQSIYDDKFSFYWRQSTISSYQTAWKNFTQKTYDYKASDLTHSHTNVRTKKSSSVFTHIYTRSGIKFCILETFLVSRYEGNEFSIAKFEKT